MKTIRTVKQASGCAGYILTGTPVMIVAMDGGKITINCQGDRHEVTIGLTAEGKETITTPNHDLSDETMDKLARNTYEESQCECFRVRDWFRGSGIFIG